MKARLIMSVAMSCAMALMVTFVATLLNLGLVSDFISYWMKAYAVAWPIAAATAFAVMPGARRLTDWIVARLDRPI